MTREEFKEWSRESFGETPDNNQIKIIEGVTGLFTESETYQQRMDEEIRKVEESWRKRYADAFYKGGNVDDSKPPTKDTLYLENERAKTITYDDIFVEVK